MSDVRALKVLSCSWGGRITTPSASPMALMPSVGALERSLAPRAYWSLRPPSRIDSQPVEEDPTGFIGSSGRLPRGDLA